MSTIRRETAAETEAEHEPELEPASGLNGSLGVDRDGRDCWRTGLPK